MDNVFLRITDLPTTIGAFTVYRDGIYTIVVNARASHEQRLESVAHELDHIRHGDFERCCDVDELEWMRHEGS